MAVIFYSVIEDRIEVSSRVDRPHDFHMLNDLPSDLPLVELGLNLFHQLCVAILTKCLAAAKPLASCPSDGIENQTIPAS